MDQVRVDVGTFEGVDEATGEMDLIGQVEIGEEFATGRERAGDQQS